MTDHDLLNNGDVASSQQVQLQRFHRDLQRKLLWILLPLCIPMYTLQVVRDACWQNYAQLFCFLAMSGLWLYGHAVTQRGQVERSLIIFALSHLAFQTVILTAFADATATSLLANVIMAIYASYFSRRLLYLTAAGAFASLMIAEALRFAYPHLPKALGPAERLGFMFFFGGMILTVAVLALRQRQIMADGLITATQALSDRKAGIIDAARRMTSVLDAVVTDLSDISRDFAEQARSQTAAVETINLEMEAVRHIAERTSLSAKAARNVTDEVHRLSRESTNRLKEVEAGFDRVVETNMVAQTEFGGLASQAESIEDILRSNREIAGQIKILAVNAGIQAAKAGTYGMGFRVVAGELKGMIQRTDESLSHSRRLLEDIRMRARQSADTIQRGSDLMHKLFSELGTAGELIETNTQRFEGTSQQVSGITDAAAEQLARLVAIENGMRQLDDASSTLSDSAVDLSAHIERISGSYASLKQVLETA